MQDDVAVVKSNFSRPPFWTEGKLTISRAKLAKSAKKTVQSGGSVTGAKRLSSGACSPCAAALPGSRAKPEVEVRAKG